jgi:hypothetical protein
MDIEIIVIRTPKGYQVKPACPTVSRGDTIAWRNYTRADIEVLLPTLFPAAERVAGDRGELRVTVGGKADGGFYPYAVYSAEANDMAIGNSSPGVIIRR